MQNHPVPDWFHRVAFQSNIGIQKDVRHILRNIVFVFFRWLSTQLYGDTFHRVVVVCPFVIVLTTKIARKSTGAERGRPKAYS